MFDPQLSMKAQSLTAQGLRSPFPQLERIVSTEALPKAFLNS